MAAEIDALKRNETWELMEPPPGVNIVDCRWVYKVKKCPDGKEKYKARLVARGFSQIYGDSYWETYAPVVKCSTVRMLLACAAERNWHIGQIDVRNAYVKSDLKETVYMRQPYGFEQGAGLVCKLKKSLYGLKQAGHEWNQCLCEHLVTEMGCVQMKSDPCIYERGTGDTRIIISVYVDDILIFGAAKNAIEAFKAEFSEKFEIDDLGDCRKIIGIEVDRTPEGSVMIRQRGFIEELLRLYGLEECNEKKTPINVSLELVCGKVDCNQCELANETEYRAIIGRLIYLAGSTRPDIAYTVSNLSRFNSKPHKTHMESAVRVLKYLKGTINHSIVYRKTGMELYGHCDADWGNCKIDRRSYTGFVMILAGGPVAWEAKKQPTVALSSTEAEYMALTSAGKEIRFCRQVLKELKLKDFCDGTTKLCSDNKSAIYLAERVGYNPRTKHIDVRHHFIRELVRRQCVMLSHVGTEDMIADICTKGLGPIKHDMNLRRLLVNRE